LKLAIICFAREGSTRLPKKNAMKLRGIPLIWYTLSAMNYIYIKHHLNGIECQRYLLTDFEDCKKVADNMNIPVIWRDHPKEWDDNRLNKWAHEIIKADNYLLLQPTSPFRNHDKILEWLAICLNNNIESAYAVRKTNDIYKRAGSFFFYSKEILAKGKLNDENSLIFQDPIDIDIDTIDDFKEAERYLDEH
jgi:CMP-N-acetylneuraminic acid synthetase